jgi:hypothetical protein
MELDLLKLVMWIGIFDAVAIIIFGAVSAALLIFASEEFRNKFFDKVGMAIFVLIGSSIAAAIVLAVTRWATS